VANGDHDLMVRTSHSADMGRRLPNARLIIYPDSGHGGVFQHHETFVPTALAFLTGDDTWEETWRRIKADDGLVHVDIPELLIELAELARETPPGDDPDWPLLLSAGERRSFTANTILRDPAWRKKDLEGARRVSPADGQRIGVASGDVVELSTKRPRRGDGGGGRHRPTRSHLASQRVRPRSRRGRSADADRCRDERVHGERGPRSVGRNPVAQDHTGTTGTAVLSC
jgi:anaerobic selenocysteine-containing dehydrogenase